MVHPPTPRSRRAQSPHCLPFVAALPFVGAERCSAILLLIHSYSIIIGMCVVLSRRARARGARHAQKPSNGRGTRPRSPENAGGCTTWLGPLINRMQNGRKKAHSKVRVTMVWHKKTANSQWRHAAPAFPARCRLGVCLGRVAPGLVLCWPPACGSAWYVAHYWIRQTCTATDDVGRPCGCAKLWGCD